MTPNDPAADPNTGSGLPLTGFTADARSLPPEDFEEKHGDGFLLLTAAELRASTGPASTDVQLDGVPEPAAERTAVLSLVVYPLRRSGRSVGHLITIGRTANNDVVLPDVSVSRFHAFVKVEDGRFLLQDAGSTNGTTVNGSSVPAQGSGPPVDLKAGDNVRVGHLEFTFVSGSALRDFVRAKDS